MLLGAACFFAIRTAALEGDPVGTFTAEALDGLTLGQRALTMLGVVPHWFRLLLWPAHLRGDYSPREIESATSWGLAQTQGALLLLLALLVTVAAWRRYPVISFGLLWTAIGIFPVSNVLVPTGIVLAERTLFLPSIGMMLVVGGFAAPIIERLRAAPRAVRALAAAAVAAVLLMGTTRSASRQRVWQDQFTFWHQTTIDAPLSYRGHHALAQLLFQIGARRWAEKEYKTAIALFPKQWGAYFDLANKLRLSGMCEQAVRYYRQTLLIEPEQEAARAGAIACLLHLGRYADARAEAREGMSYASRPARLKVFQKFLAVADSAQRRKAPPATVRFTITAADTLP
jgi:tetratricopeptide (TPR) repeat protein